MRHEPDKERTQLGKILLVFGCSLVGFGYHRIQWIERGGRLPNACGSYTGVPVSERRDQSGPLRCCAKREQKHRKQRQKREPGEYRQKCQQELLTAGRLAPLGAFGFVVSATCEKPSRQNRNRGCQHGHNQCDG